MFFVSRVETCPAIFRKQDGFSAKRASGHRQGSESPQMPRRPSTEHKKQPRFCVVLHVSGLSCSHSPTFSAVIFGGRSGVRPAPVRGKPGIRQVPSAILPILIYRDSLHQGMTSGTPGTGMPQETVSGTGRTAFYSIFSSCDPACTM